MARIGRGELVDAFEFAERLMGGNSVVVLDRLASGARLRMTDDGYRVELRDGLPDINFACAHEVAHWALRVVFRYTGDDEERLANRLGAALLMPREIVLRSVKDHGDGLLPVGPLAWRAEVSATAAHLRLAEVIGDERAIVTKNRNVLVRNARLVDWSAPEVVASVDDGRDHPQLAKAKLCGGIDEGRFALLAKTTR